MRLHGSAVEQSPGSAAALTRVSRSSARVSAMTITASAAGAAASAHTITYSAARSALGLTALSPAATPNPGTYTVPAASGAGGSVRIQLSVYRTHTRVHTLPSTIPAAVDPLGPASASQTSYRPALRRAQPAMRFPA